ncbi:hypothetical protein [Pseudomonas asplenii]|uniref:hypothetical protein n=1 Tax=Pseudomonas asplenii TaxID=53407 RepID=UPI0006B61FC9|nr:hypothetical protein [Pseudomonas fuscovaginae]
MDFSLVADSAHGQGQARFDLDLRREKPPLGRQPLRQHSHSPAWGHQPIGPVLFRAALHRQADGLAIQPGVAQADGEVAPSQTVGLRPRRGPVETQQHGRGPGADDRQAQSAKTQRQLGLPGLDWQTPQAQRAEINLRLAQGQRAVMGGNG